ncbi:hypothetical protein LZ30DRAFT_3411 [Colletotrichum cereale]|nr:hypothetical protein LZ30DRAFT_3411 [Colletotrichum cereale]
MGLSSRQPYTTHHFAQHESTHPDRIGLRSRSCPRGVHMDCNARPTAYERRTLPARLPLPFPSAPEHPRTRTPAIAPSALSWLPLHGYTGRERKASGGVGNGKPRHFPFLTLTYLPIPSRICVSEFVHLLASLPIAQVLEALATKRGSTLAAPSILSLVTHPFPHRHPATPSRD